MSSDVTFALSRDQVLRIYLLDFFGNEVEDGLALNCGAACSGRHTHGRPSYRRNREHNNSFPKYAVAIMAGMHGLRRLKCGHYSP